MRIHIKLLIAAVAVISVAGCQRYRVSGLDNSVDARINDLIDSYVDELVASEHGWLATINTSKGYYQFWFDFHKDNQVTMYTDNSDYAKYKTEAQETTYAFRALQRPTLTFDTYSYLHIINDPDHSISKGSGNNGKGLVTDYEFEVVRFDQEADVFYMQGRFNKVNAIFRKASVDDKIGVEEGLMMDRLNTVFLDTRWMNKYIRGQHGSSEIAVKLYDRRNMYQFWYNTRSGKGIDEMGYYNVEVDKSDNLFFPEPIEMESAKITGLRFDATLNTFDAFLTEDKNVTIPVVVSSTPPEFRLSEVFGSVNSGKMYDEGIGAGLGSAVGSGHTSDALDMLGRFLTYEGFNLVLSYDLRYYFTEEERQKTEEEMLEDDDPRYQKYFNVYLAPSGFGFKVGSESGTFEPVVTYAPAQYKFKVTDFDDKELTFALSGSYESNKAGQDYYNGKITNAIVDGFKGKEFTIQWSEVPLNHGLLVDFMPKPTALVPNPNAKDNFVPPAILTRRGGFPEDE